jgi:hypothetical protein
MPEAAAALESEFSPIASANLAVVAANASTAATGPSLSAGVSVEPEVVHPYSPRNPWMTRAESTEVGR